MEKVARIIEDYSLTDTRKFVVEYEGKDYLIHLPSIFNSFDPTIMELKEVKDNKTRVNLCLLCRKYAETHKPKKAEVGE